MATEKQKRVADLIIQNATADKPLTQGEIVENSGYAPSMSKNSHVVMNSDGVLEALEIKGFTEVAAQTVVSEIMNNSEVEPNARLKAADMTFKVHGSYAPEKSNSTNVIIVTDKIKEIANELRRRIR